MSLWFRLGWGTFFKARIVCFRMNYIECAPFYQSTHYWRINKWNWKCLYYLDWTWRSKSCHAVSSCSTIRRKSISECKFCLGMLLLLVPLLLIVSISFYVSNSSKSIDCRSGLHLYPFVVLTHNSYHLFQVQCLWLVNETGTFLMVLWFISFNLFFVFFSISIIIHFFNRWVSSSFWWYFFSSHCRSFIKNLANGYWKSYFASVVLHFIMEISLISGLWINCAPWNWSFSTSNFLLFLHQRK